MYNGFNYSDELYHHGILGQKWGIRRFQNSDGSLTAEGKKRYDDYESKASRRAEKRAERRAEKQRRKEEKAERKNPTPVKFEDNIVTYKDGTMHAYYDAFGRPVPAESAYKYEQALKKQYKAQMRTAGVALAVTALSGIAGAYLNSRGY